MNRLPEWALSTERTCEKEQSRDENTRIKEVLFRKSQCINGRIPGNRLGTHTVVTHGCERFNT